jgi:nucleoside-diphosphate-sugar epimerase
LPPKLFAATLEPSPGNPRDEDPDERLETRAVLFVEAAGLGRVHVEHAAQDILLDHGDDDLRPRRGIARDVSGKPVHVGHDDGLPARGGLAANAFPDRDSNTGGLALERAEHEIVAAQNVEAAPVDAVERVREERDRVGDVRERVGLALQERRERGFEIAVALSLGPGRIDLNFEHARILSGENRGMRVLITGAAGNLGSRLALSLLDSPHELRLMVHKRPLPFDVGPFPRVSIVRADLEDPAGLKKVCEGVDCVVHFAGVLFAPRPETFLPRTNTGYVQNLVGAAREAGVGKFILISFPHVEGETTPARRATGRLDGNPDSFHARTRLAAERHLFEECRGTRMTPVVLRAGMIYGRGILMIEAARWLLRRRLLAVWRHPTWNHLLAIPDFLRGLAAAIESEKANGIYNLADDQPLTLQEFLDRIADHWGYPRPRRVPEWSVFAAAACCEVFASVFGTISPLTRDFIRIGMASSVADTSRTKSELLPLLEYPTLREGLSLL